MPLTNIGVISLKLTDTLLAIDYLLLKIADFLRSGVFNAVNAQGLEDFGSVSLVAILSLDDSESVEVEAMFVEVGLVRMRDA